MPESPHSRSGDSAIRWFAIWTTLPGGGLYQTFKKHRDALAARTPGTNRAADVIVKTTKAELDHLGNWQRTFR